VDERLAGFLAVPTETLPSNLEPEDLGFVRLAAGLVSRALERLKLRAQSIDLERALEIQRNLLPRSVPEVPGGRFAVFWKPSRSVGGDLYDFFDFGGGRFGFAIADVSGKGMPAALIMSNLQAAFRAVIDETCPPEEACRRLNRSAVNLLGDGRFVTYFYGVYDSEHQVMVYCNAGHCAPLLLREDGSAERLESGGPVLGVLPDVVFESGRVHLRAGDRIVLYTDGLSEAASADGEEFGETRVGEVCRTAWDLGPEAMIRALVDAIREHSAGELQDDLTVLVLALGKPGGTG
jgi:sigma-B regulation protein RsbU (phosphoserine phosphatase)